MAATRTEFAIFDVVSNRLTLDENKLGGPGYAMVRGSSAKITTVGIFRSRSVHVSQQDVLLALALQTQLAKALSGNEKLRVLSIRNTASEVESFAEFLMAVEAGNFTLRELDARDNKTLVQDTSWQSSLMRLHFEVFYG